METVSFEDFKKLDLRVGKILEAEAVTGSEKLVKLQVDLGAEIGKRQILAGIIKDHPPETLIGREIIVVANLEPRKLMGFESQGMLLAASDGEAVVLLEPEKETPPGATIR
ncbi:MAG: methionine--tRNA ligase subunit beta [Patescibacteria group bacterium]